MTSPQHLLIAGTPLPLQQGRAPQPLRPNVKGSEGAQPAPSLTSEHQIRASAAARPIACLSVFTGCRRPSLASSP